MKQKKQILTFTPLLLVAMLVIGFLTSGRDFDKSKVSLIKMGETNETELVQWFGLPTNRGISKQDTNLDWHEMLHVSLGPDGKVKEVCVGPSLLHE